MKGSVKIGWIFHGNIGVFYSAIPFWKKFKKFPTPTTEYSQIGYEYDGTPDELRIINSEDNGDISFFHGSPTVSGVHKTVTITRLGTAPSHTPFLGVGTDVPLTFSQSNFTSVGVSPNPIVFAADGKGQFNGNLEIAGDLFVGSDQNIKHSFNSLSENWTPILKINPYSYYFKTDSVFNFPTNQCYGFKAQQVQQYIPSLVHDNGKFLMLNYSGFIPFIVAGLQEHENKIQQLAVVSQSNEDLIELNELLTQKVETLENEIRDLKNQILIISKKLNDGEL